MSFCRVWFAFRCSSEVGSASVGSGTSGVNFGGAGGIYIRRLFHSSESLRRASFSLSLFSALGSGLIASPPGRGLPKIAPGSSVGCSFLLSLWPKYQPRTFFLSFLFLSLPPPPYCVEEAQGVKTVTQKHVPQLKLRWLGCFQRSLFFFFSLLSRKPPASLTC